MKKTSKSTAAFVVIIVAAAFFIGVIQMFSPPKKDFADVVPNMSIVRGSNFFYDYEITRYPSTVEIVGIRQNNTFIGFDLDPAKLSFGTLPGNGSYAKKIINLTNEINRSVMVSVSAHGRIAQFVTFSDTQLVLKPKQNFQVDAFFNSKAGNTTAEIGNYTGEVDVAIEIPKYDYVYWFWGSR